MGQDHRLEPRPARARLRSRRSGPAAARRRHGAAGAGTPSARRGTPPLATPTVRVLGSTATSAKLEVEGATRPFWLVLGESLNAGWEATGPGGQSLGPPQLIDGYANGWYVTPPPGGAFTVTLQFDAAEDRDARRASSPVATLALCLMLGFVPVGDHPAPAAQARSSLGARIVQAAAGRASPHGRPLGGTRVSGVERRARVPMLGSPLATGGSPPSLAACVLLAAVVRCRRGRGPAATLGGLRLPARPQSPRLVALRWSAAAVAAQPLGGRMHRRGRRVTVVSIRFGTTTRPARLVAAATSRRRESSRSSASSPSRPMLRRGRPTTAARRPPERGGGRTTASAGGGEREAGPRPGGAEPRPQARPGSRAPSPPR